MTLARGDSALYNNDGRAVLAEVVYANSGHRGIRIVWYDGESKHTRVVWAKSLQKIMPARVRQSAMVLA